MPYKKSETKGDLYLIVQIDFPDHDWLQQNERIAKLQELLPRQTSSIATDIVDEVEYDDTARLSDFGAGEQNADDDGGWEDADEENGAEAQCAQQ